MWSVWKTAMVGREGDGPQDSRAFGLSLALAAALTGCGPAKVPDAVALPPVSESQAQTPPQKTPAEDVVASPTPPSVVVIDRGGEGGAPAPKGLAQAALEERQRRAQAGKPVAVIDNKNLAEFSKGQKLTVASGSGSDPSGSAATEQAVRAAAEEARDEAYWRNRGLALRKLWRESTDRIAELEGQTEALRRKFYAADDPYVRDAQIKPEWDHALDELEKARQTSSTAEADLERFLVEGREAGALPGWLREGSDLEPEKKAPSPPTAEPKEPVVVEEPRPTP